MSKIVQVFSLIANGAGAAPSGSAKSTKFGSFIEGTLMPFLSMVGDKVMNWFMSFFVVIIQFMLRIVDFFQFFVGRLAGIDTWSAKGAVGNVRLADTDVIFRFLLSDSVLKAFIAILGLSIALLIIFTIIAIVKTDYSAAVDADGKADGSKSKVLKKAGQSLFVLLIVPFILVFGILGSNAILASLNNALKGNSTISMGGQIFSASSYEANRYRKYADNNLRIPVDFENEVLHTIYVPDKSRDALGGLVYSDVIGNSLFVAPMGYHDDKNSAKWGWATRLLGVAASSNYASATLYAKVNGDQYNRLTSQYILDENGIATEELNPDFYEEGTRALKDKHDNYYIEAGRVVFHKGRGGFSSGLLSVVGSVGRTNISYIITRDAAGKLLTEGEKKEGYSGFTYSYDTNFKDLDNGSMSLTQTVGGGNLYVIPELTQDGIVMDWYAAGDSGVPITMYSLGYMSIDANKNNDTNIINAVYRTWKFNERACEKVNLIVKQYENFKFENSYNATQTTVTTMATGDNQTRNDVYTFSNKEQTKGGRKFYYDYDFTPIRDEYYVMADFMDYALEHGLKFYFVNSSNPLIEWNSNTELGSSQVSTKYLTGTGENGKVDSCTGFIVEYASGINRYYENKGEKSEVDGETFIVCTKVGDYYVPITQSGNRSTGFVSSYLAEDYRGPIVARGVFDADGNPTRIQIENNIDSYEVGYYALQGTGGATSGSTYNDENGQISGGVDKIKGADEFINKYQSATGVLRAYNAAGGVIGNNLISYTHVKVAEVYTENGLQYIKLHFYNRSANDSESIDGNNISSDQNDRHYNYLFSANVIGTPSGQLDEKGNPIYESSVFNSSTVYTVNGQSFATKPKGTALDNAIEYIYFNRSDMSRKIGFDFAMGTNGFLSLFDEQNQSNLFYFRFKIGLVYDFDEETVYNLTNGSAIIDYNFMTSDGIALTNLYRPGDLNIIILLFATILIFTVLAQAVWGLIARIYEIVLMFIMYPGFVSTIPVDDGSRFKKWRENVVKKVLGAYGVILGINIFFILLPVVRDATYIFKAEDIPAALQGRSFFGNADFLNRIVYIMFLLVLFTLIKTLPKLVSELVGGDDVYTSGGGVKKNVNDSVKAVGDTMSGKKLLAAASNAKALAGDFIPGSAIAKATKASIEKRTGKDLSFKGMIKGIRDHRAEKDTEYRENHGGKSKHQVRQDARRDSAIKKLRTQAGNNGFTEDEIAGILAEAGTDKRVQKAALQAKLAEQKKAEKQFAKENPYEVAAAEGLETYQAILSGKLTRKEKKLVKDEKIDEALASKKARAEKAQGDILEKGREKQHDIDAAKFMEQFKGLDLTDVEKGALDRTIENAKTLEGMHDLLQNKYSTLLKDAQNRTAQNQLNDLLAEAKKSKIWSGAEIKKFADDKNNDAVKKKEMLEAAMNAVKSENSKLLSDEIIKNLDKKDLKKIVGNKDLSMAAQNKKLQDLINEVKLNNLTSQANKLKISIPAGANVQELEGLINKKQQENFANPAAGKRKVKQANMQILNDKINNHLSELGINGTLKNKKQMVNVGGAATRTAKGGSRSGADYARVRKEASEAASAIMTKQVQNLKSEMDKKLKTYKEQMDAKVKKAEESVKNAKNNKSTTKLANEAKKLRTQNNDLNKKIAELQKKLSDDKLTNLDEIRSLKKEIEHLIDSTKGKKKQSEDDDEE